MTWTYRYLAVGFAQPEGILTVNMSGQDEASGDLRNASGGKFTLAKKLADITGLPLHPIRSIKYRPGDERSLARRVLRDHAKLMRNELWIIDGFGCAASACHSDSQQRIRSSMLICPCPGTMPE